MSKSGTVKGATFKKVMTWILPGILGFFGAQIFKNHALLFGGFLGEVFSGSLPEFAGVLKIIDIPGVRIFVKRVVSDIRLYCNTGAAAG